MPVDGSEPRVRIFEDADALARGAAVEFLQRAGAAVDAKGSFRVALSGGSTPRRLFRWLSAEPCRSAVPWERIHFFWGDERTVPPQHPESNFGAAEEALLSRVPVRAENVHRIEAERSPPGRAAAEYEATLRRVFRLSEDEWPRFDLVFLGLGADGHTASLFPGTDAVDETRRLVVSTWVERLAAHRLTLTCPVFNHAACILFLVSGADKAEVLAEILTAEVGEVRYPAQLIRPTEGELHWYIDQAADRALGRSN
ncbi:MAG: 6-phosphogluconolactonase [Gemmatimonadales bacterium]|jgi:6-phosphogluconolactonase